MHPIPKDTTERPPRHDCPRRHRVGCVQIRFLCDVCHVARGSRPEVEVPKVFGGLGSGSCTAHTKTCIDTTWRTCSSGPLLLHRPGIQNTPASQGWHIATLARLLEGSIQYKTFGPLWASILKKTTQFQQVWTAMNQPRPHPRTRDPAIPLARRIP